MTRRRGSYRDLVHFERREAASSAYVNGSAGWEKLTTLSASIVSRKGSEPVIADRQRGVAGVEITVDAIAALNSLSTDDRIVDARDEARVFNIRHIDRETGRGTIILTADTGTPGEG